MHIGDESADNEGEAWRRYQKRVNAKVQTRPDIDADIRDAVNVTVSLGGNVRKYQRERRRIANRTVSEVYSRPRITAMAKMMPSFGVIPGFALDLATCDDDGCTGISPSSVIVRLRERRLTGKSPFSLSGRHLARTCPHGRT